MTRTADHSRHTRGWSPFFRHYLEMLAAMLVGMAVLGAAVRGVLAFTGLELPEGRPEPTVLEMAFTMSAGMAVWMRYRGHRWPAVLEMAASMVVPVAVLLPLLWTGMLEASAVLLLEHVLMLPLMLLVMLRRRDEYGGPARA